MYPLGNRYSRTWKLPGVELVQINLGDDWDGEALAGDLLAEVMDDELLVRRVEPEARRQVELGLGVSWSSNHASLLRLQFEICFSFVLKCLEA